MAGKKNKKTKNGKKSKSQQQQQQQQQSNNGTNEDGSWLMVDPAFVRFQHSRIRPYFSGCGRGVQDTLEEIRRGGLRPEDLPPIQVLVGPQPWYFSLNNRRLWVLKRCREEGLLLPNNNTIRVRVRPPKSPAEAQRYTVENCALEAKFLREGPPKNNPKTNDTRKLPPPPSESTTIETTTETTTTETTTVAESHVNKDEAEVSQAFQSRLTVDSDESDSEEDDDDGMSYTNPFAALS